jgi:hypothetical protein
MKIKFWMNRNLQYFTCPTHHTAHTHQTQKFIL